MPPALAQCGPHERLDVTDRDALAALVRKHSINTIYHMAAILSATGEEKPRLAWTVNIGGLYNILEVAVESGVSRIYHPSSIAAFGPETPKDATPQETVLRPTTMYGVTKVTGEMLGAYYHRRFGLDVRGIRYPGVISSETPPGGGTTDYAVAIFYEAIRKGRYTCFVREDTVLPMIYMPDTIRRDPGIDGRRRVRAEARVRVQPRCADFLGGRVGCGDQEADPGVRGGVQARLSPADRGLVAEDDRRLGRARGVGLAAAVRSGRHGGRYAREAREEAQRE